jgi:hypothetical protein
VTLDVGQRNPRRLLHHVAELAGQDHPALAGHGRGLDEQHVAADAGHRQAGRDAGTAVRTAASWKNFGRPSASRRRAIDRHRRRHLLRRRDLRRGFRSSVPSSRSSWRTPASRV